MRVAILFWVYKDLALCTDRIKHLRELDHRTPIYCLYGGPLISADLFRDGLESLVDDFYVYPADRPAYWKWLHGDQLISSWYRERGAGLNWDTIFVAQWDLLLLSPVGDVCRALRSDQVLFPGLRRIRDVETSWWWTRPGSPERAEFEEFCESLAQSGNA